MNSILSKMVQPLSLYFLLFSLCSASTLLAEDCQELTGKVIVDSKALVHAKVTLFEACQNPSKLLENTHTDCHGEYKISFNAPSGTRLYLLATDCKRPEIVLAGAFINKKTSQHIVLNEVTTVATAYCLSQFIESSTIMGPSPGLDNAIQLIENLVDLSSGKAAKVVSNSENGAKGNPRSTRALKTQNTLANLIAGCVLNKNACELLFSLLNACCGLVTNTFEAIHEIALHPFIQDNAELHAFAAEFPIYTPMLKIPPASWVIALHYTDGGFSAPGRVAFDSQGTVWSNNNFMPPAGNLLNLPGRQVTVVNPQGVAILGSPIYSQHVFGSGYGVAVDSFNNCWISSFADGQIAQFCPNGTLIQNARNLNHPMGMEVDQMGNLWITNMGDPTDPLDFGYVTVYIAGNPNNRIDHVSSIHKPFSLAIDSFGRVWVANSGFAPVGSVTILELTKDFEIEVVQDQLTSNALGHPPEPGMLRPYGDFASPKTIAIDINDNGWISNLETNEVSFIDGQTFEVIDYPADPRSRGWGLAVDANNFIWVASFTNPPLGPLFQKPPVISVIQGFGFDSGAFLYSFSNPSLQHITGLQIDSSGNVWAVNNWSLETTPSQVVGGDGLVQFIGLAKPVAAPLIGPPRLPE